MRSRYTAFVVGDADYLARTWHARTRPEAIRMDQTLTWTGLRIIETDGGAEADTTGTVEFIASFIEDSVHGELHERSRFARRAGRWAYVDGEVS
jgi:SEC-C motif-containing protein